MKHPLFTSMLSLLLVGHVTIVLGQQTDSSGRSESVICGSFTEGSGPTRISPEEQQIRAAYERLRCYNRESHLYRFEAKAEDLTPDKVVHFQLKNFRTASIDEIKDMYLADLAPLPTGEILHFNIGHRSMNGGPSEAFFEADWKRAQTSGGNWFKPKVSDLFDLAAAEYFDVGKYTTYEVVASYLGQSRSYKTAVLHHNLHQSSLNPRVEFLDHYLENGALDRVVREMDPPVKRENQ